MNQTHILTSLVIEYKETKNQAVLDKICKMKLIRQLIFNVMKYYGLLQMPEEVQVDIYEDCRSIVLHRSIEKFDITKKTQFSTLYVWWLMSHIRARKNYYMNEMRFHTLVTPSYFNEKIQETIYNKDGEEIEDKQGIYSTFKNLNNLQVFKKNLQEIFK